MMLQVFCNITGYALLGLSLVNFFRIYKNTKIKYNNDVICLSGRTGYGFEASRIIKYVFYLNSLVQNFYNTHILKYSRFRFYKLVVIKIAIFFGALLVLVLIKITNISIQTDRIFNKFDYYSDLIYTVNFTGDRNEALKQEIFYLKRVIKEIGKKAMDASENDIQLAISSLIDAEDRNLLLPREALINRIYYRLKDYYEVRKINIIPYLLGSAAASFIPECFFIFHIILAGADRKRELRFLKKLIILNGSIKPVDFNEVLKILIDKSRYYKRILQEIEDMNRRNSVDNGLIYSSLIKKLTNINEKLFFEKLGEANNYDFDQAVQNIENEFRLERQETARRIRKRIEIINVAGLTGLMAVIAIMVFYLIFPWIRMYNMNSLGF